MTDLVVASPGSDVLSLILEFARTEQGGDPYAFRLDRLQYLVRGADGSFETAELNWDKALLADLETVQKPHPEPEVVQRLGETLRRFLAPAGWAEHEVELLQAVKEQRRVVLTVRSAAAELYALPWELMTLKGTGQHLAELPDVLVRYEWPGTSTAPEPKPSSPSGGRILVCWSATGGAVPAAEHIAAIRKASEKAPYAFDLGRDVLENASPEKLDEILDAAQRIGPPIAALHILCHGRRAGGSFGLALDGGDPGADATVDAGRLRQLLTPYTKMIRLVVLSACDSGNSGEVGTELGSVAQALHRAGLAHVLASRYPLSVEGSIRLTQVLYRELFSDHGSLEQGVLEARRELSREAACIDWVSLQLYARASEPPFLGTSYLRGPEPTAQPADARAAIQIAVSRRKLLFGAVAVGTALLAAVLLSALWPDDPDEGPIVLENGRCLNLDQGDFETQRDGGEVNQWVCHGGANQNWYQDGRRIINHNGLCLEVSPPDYKAAKDGGRIQVGVCNPKLDNQQWQYNKKELRTYNNKCLAIELRDFDSGKQGGPAVQWECTGKPNQSFTDGHRSR